MRIVKKVGGTIEDTELVEGVLLNQNVITSAGVSAGIDMAFHLVVRLVGVERARQVRRGIQYDPEPPI